MKKYLFFLLVTVFCNDIPAQPLDNANYVVFNFVHHHEGIPSHSGNFVDNYYWIVPIDSINNKSVFSINPLIVNAETQHEVDKCSTGNSANFFGFWEGASEKYINEIDSFIKIVNRNRKKLQTITLKWHQNKIRKKEKIEVYAVPVSGIFCNCFQEYYRGALKEDEFSGQIYIPLSNFEYNESFWDTQEWKIVEYVDNSIVNFAAFTPWGYQYKTGSLVKTSK
jgi:hypothetical protein